MYYMDHRGKNIFKCFIINYIFVYLSNIVLTFGGRTGLKRHDKFLYRAHSWMAKADYYASNEALK